MGKNDLNTLCVDTQTFEKCRRGLSDLLSSCVCMSTSRTETHKNSVERHLMQKVLNILQLAPFRV